VLCFAVWAESANFWSRYRESYLEVGQFPVGCREVLSGRSKRYLSEPTKTSQKKVQVLLPPEGDITRVATRRWKNSTATFS
jgi:hypothetical protein